MTEPASTRTLEVLQNRELVGTLERTPDGCVFRYTDEFLQSAQPQIARGLPKRQEGIHTAGTANLPPYFAGLLPEGVMLEAVTRGARLSRDDLFGILAATGSDAIGDITIRIPGQEQPSRNKGLADAISRLKAVVAGRSFSGVRSISGVQPKLSIGEAIASMRGEVAIVKMEPQAFPCILDNELFFMGLARHAGLKAARVRLADDLLVVTRFDRVKRPDGFPDQLHVEDSLQLMNRYPWAKYSIDYLEIMDVAAGLGVSRAVHLDLLRLYAYSYAIGNGDLHAKNVSLMYDGGLGLWMMTPAYDLVCTLPYAEQLTGGNLMALGLDEQVGDFVGGDFVRVGAKYGLPEKAVVTMLTRVSQGVSGHVRSSPMASEICDEIVARASRVLPA